MKRTWIFFATLFVAATCFASSPSTGLKSHKQPDQISVSLQDITPRQVIYILRAAAIETGIRIGRLVRKYRNGTLTIASLGNGTFLVTISRAGGDFIEVLIDTDF